MTRKLPLIKNFLLVAFYCSVSLNTFAQFTNGNFETLPAFTGWTIVNNGTNNWFCGAPGANAGANGAYISNNGGATNSYNNSVSQVSHFYQTINIAAGQNILNFNWRTLGENCCDFLEIFLVPVGTTVTAGVRLGIANRVAGPLVNQSAWQVANINLGCQAAPTTMMVVFSWVNDFSLGAPPVAIDNISIINSPLPTTGLTCANAINIGALPYNVSGHSTACMNNDYTGATAGICNGTFAFGEDRVYSYTATGPECISITITGASSNNINYAVYQGCPGGGGTCISSNGPAVANTLSGSVTLPGAGTYYIIIDSQSPSTNVSYNLLISSFGAGAPNDRPFQAQFLPFNIPIPGNTTCSGNIDEPAAPPCFGPGGNILNTVWYYFTAPVSGCVKLRTNLGTMTNTQIAVFGPVFAPVPAGSGNTLVLIGCNNDQPACGFNTYANSQLTVSGLITGASYYVMVDGYGNQTGSFSIYLIDGGVGCNNNFPPTPGQDCPAPFPVCKSNINVANPGPQAIGVVCDFTSGVNCLASGERGSYWYKVIINAAGFLEFDIVPNDWPGPPSLTATDYDWAVWRTKTAGVPGPANCSNLNSTAPVSCNYSALGVTGTFGTLGNSPPAYPGFGGAYEPRITVNAGDEYLINVSNFSNSTSGYALNFSATSPIAYTPPVGGNLIWTGSLSTDWYNPENWGGCAVPSCVYNVVIPAAPINQPLVTGLTAVCGSIDINFGATLTMAGNSQLKVCTDYINNGTLTAGANSTILMQSDSVLQNQNMTGSMTGANRLWNLVINKPVTAGGNTVFLNNDLDNAGNFTVGTGGTYVGSIFEAGSQYHKVAGNFTIYYAAVPYGVYNPGTILEFNGTAAQNYYNRGLLNNVVMNHTGPGVSLPAITGVLDLMQIGVGGTLFLNQGKIIPIPATGRVFTFNPLPGSVTTGNINSYVEGWLRRMLQVTGGSYDFPVGTAARGYERINYNLQNPNDRTILQVRFNDMTLAYPVLGPDCGIAMYDQPMLDHGFWIINVTPTTGTSGLYNTTAYNRSYTNPMAAFTVMYRNGATWGLQGTCTISPITAVQRNGMSVMTNNGIYAIAQSLTPLPVELISFDASPGLSEINLKWITASEKNNKGFELLKSTSPPDFHPVGWVDGNGTSSSANEYSFTDRNVETGTTYYYQLRQIDLDGKATLSDIVAAKINNEPFQINILPNPYSGNTQIFFSLKEEADVTIDVLNLMGQKITILDQGIKPAGDYHYNFSAKSSGFPSGIYSVRIFYNGEYFTRRIVEME